MHRSQLNSRKSVSVELRRDAISASRSPVISADNGQRSGCAYFFGPVIDQPARMKDVLAPCFELGPFQSARRREPALANRRKLVWETFGSAQPLQRAPFMEVIRLVRINVRLGMLTGLCRHQTAQNRAAVSDTINDRCFQRRVPSAQQVIRPMLVGHNGKSFNRVAGQVSPLRDDAAGFGLQSNHLPVFGQPRPRAPAITSVDDALSKRCQTGLSIRPRQLSGPTPHGDAVCEFISPSRVQARAGPAACEV